MKYALITGWLTFVFLFGACTTGPGPQEILAKSHDSMRQVQSYRFSDETVQETEDRVLKARVSGVWVSPNRWYMKVEPQGEFAGQVTETVAIGHRLFTRESGANGGSVAGGDPFSGKLYRL